MSFFFFLALNINNFLKDFNKDIYINYNVSLKNTSFHTVLFYINKTHVNLISHSHLWGFFTATFGHHVKSCCSN